MIDGGSELPTSPAPGLFKRSVGFGRRVVVDWIVDHLKQVLSLLVLPLTYGFLAAEDVAPSPAEIVQSVTERTEGTSDIVRPQGVASVEFISDKSSAGAIGEAIHLSVVPKIRSVPPDLAGLHIQYGLTDLRAASGSANQVDLRWALRLDGESWTHCSQAGIRFVTRQALARDVARAINNSLAATETNGRITCS